MKVYKFVFAVGILNVVIPFLGIPTIFKNYTFITLGICALVYSLITRTLVKEQEAGLSVQEESSKQEISRTIDDVVEMTEQEQKKRKISTIKKRPTIKATSDSVRRVVIQEEKYD